ncbi:MAG: hypothetical protein ACC669_10720, partial [bacterium]
SWAGMGLFGEVAKAAAASIIMFVVSRAVAVRLPWMEFSTLERLWWLSVCVLLGIIVYSAAAFALRAEGMEAVKKRMGEWVKRDVGN